MTDIFNNLKVISIDTNNFKKCDNDCDENSFITNNWCSTNCTLNIESHTDNINISIYRKGTFYNQELILVFIILFSLYRR